MVTSGEEEANDVVNLYAFILFFEGLKLLPSVFQLLGFLMHYKAHFMPFLLLGLQFLPFLK